MNKLASTLVNVFIFIMGYGIAKEVISTSPLEHFMSGIITGIIMTVVNTAITGDD